ncbi:tigger transposable element-derived protein 1 [Trichonephila clavipes]|nr:tigger transposable element-derived protein 1 [Trichonephila clavipes]
MPNCIYITKDEKSVPGHKPMKDRFTLLLGANASRDMKLKPLLIYHSENPRALKNSIIKSKLPRSGIGGVRGTYIEELIMGHEDELTTEELQEILNQEHQETQRNVSPSEQERDERGSMPTHLPSKIF